MPWFLNPSAYRGLPVYQNPEFYLFALKVLAAAVFAAAMWRRGARGRQLAAGTWVFFYGLFLAAMLSMHSVVILGLRLFERPAGAPFVYDFNLYALLLVGAAFISQGVRYVRAAPRLCAADVGGRREALRASCCVLVCVFVSFLVLFLSRFCSCSYSCFLCLSDFVSKKKSV